MDFTYTPGRLSDDAVAELATDFHTLQPNEYADGAYRLRRFSRFTYDRPSGELERLPHAPFVQSSRINRFQGDVERDYDEILDSTWRSQGFAEMAGHFAREAGLPDATGFECHQIRVISPGPGEPVETAPEGVHQDGWERIGMFTIDRPDAEGAELLIHPGREDEAVETLPPVPGSCVVLNDAEFWHSATPIVAVSDDRAGYWDLFVLTADR